jgi:hypothetical protein
MVMYHSSEDDLWHVNEMFVEEADDEQDAIRSVIDDLGPKCKVEEVAARPMPQVH